MCVTEIKKVGKYKYQVFLDGEFAFWLSFRELRFWKIAEGGELSEACYAKIMKETVLEKCKRKAIEYLKYADRTEAELRDRLSRQFYVESVIDDTITYLRYYGYLDDTRCIRNFIEKNKNNHSKRWIESKLKQKGVTRDQCDSLWGEEYSEEEPARKLLEKKLKGKIITEKKEKDKALGYLYRQGFSSAVVWKVWNAYVSEHESF